MCGGGSLSPRCEVSPPFLSLSTFYVATLGGLSHRILGKLLVAAPAVIWLIGADLGDEGAAAPGAARDVLSGCDNELGESALGHGAASLRMVFRFDQHR